MQITIDYTPAVHQRAGIGRYTRGLVAALARLNVSHHIRLMILGRKGAYYIPERLPPNFSLRWIPLSDRWATVLWYRLRLPLPVDWLAGHCDLFHGPSFTLPPCRARALVTVHDLSYLRYAQGAHPALLAWLTAAVRRSVRRAYHVLADSHHTRRDLIELLGVPAARITVVGAGVDDRFRPIEDPQEQNRVRARYRLPERFVLGVSTLEPRKNFTGLIAAFEQLAARPLPGAPLHLVIAGDKGWLYDDIFAAAATSLARERIHFIGFVRDDDLPALYSLAEVFAFPSHYEGFGIPVLEAMACGTPVVCANNSSLPEVAGDAALMIEATDIEGLAQAMQRLITDADLRQELRRRGLTQAGKFTWEAAAQRLLGVYDRLARPASKP